MPPGGLRAPRSRSGTPAAVRALEEAAALGWPAPETRRLGGWLLRAGAGWTGRANSVLPLGEPGVPMDAALAEVRGWYADRGLAARFALPLPGAEALDAELARRGWAAHEPTAVLAAEVAAALGGLPERPDLPPPTVEPEPSAEWIAAYRSRSAAGAPEQARTILAGTPPIAFATVRLHGAVVAIARASIDRGWLGLSAVEVNPARRGRGLGRHAVGAALAWGARAGAQDAYAQVLESNDAALALFTGLGFALHHRYRYRGAPD